MQIQAQSIIEQVRFAIEHQKPPNSDKPADVLRLTAATLLKQACDCLDAAEEQEAEARRA